MTEIPPELNDIIKDVDSNGSGAHPRRWLRGGAPFIVKAGLYRVWRGFCRVLIYGLANHVRAFGNIPFL